MPVVPGPLKHKAPLLMYQDKLLASFFFSLRCLKQKTPFLSLFMLLSISAPGKAACCPISQLAPCPPHHEGSAGFVSFP